jgi:AcrR family transcriptional regulator
MGRPSVATQRRREILDATLRRLATHGYSGTTLDGIAEEAGMARGHVRHYAGNREQLLIDAARDFFTADADAAPSVLPAHIDTLEGAVDFLFDDFAAPTDDNGVALALVEGARTVPAIREILVAAYLSVPAVLERLLADAAPHATAEERSATAYGLLTLALGHVFLTDIEESAARTRLARQSADRLVASLTAT